MAELRQTGPCEFESAASQSGLRVILAACDPAGNYGAVSPLQQVNVVELVCSDVGDVTRYDALAIQIATFLGWFAFEDHGQRQVWPLLQ